MWYELNINKNLDLGLIFKVSLLSKLGNLYNTHFTVSNLVLSFISIFIYLCDRYFPTTTMSNTLNNLTNKVLLNELQNTLMS